MKKKLKKIETENARKQLKTSQNILKMLWRTAVYRKF